jgi:hypothetical protein
MLPRPTAAAAEAKTKDSRLDQRLDIVFVIFIVALGQFFITE